MLLAARVMLASNSNRLARSIKLGPMYGSVIASDCLRDYYSSGKGGHDTAVRSKPNVLIYSGDNGELFSEARRILETVLDPDGCLVYHLSSEEARRSHWMSSARALVLIKTPSSDAVRRSVADFVISPEATRSARLLHWTEVPICVEERLVRNVQDDEEWRQDSTEAALVYRCKLKASNHNTLRRVLTQFHLPIRREVEEGSIPKLTPGYLICSDAGLKKLLLTKMSVTIDPVHRSGKAKSKTRLTFTDKQSDSEVFENQVSVLTDTTSPTFDANLFLSHLNTKEFGRLLIHVPVVGTAFELLGSDLLVGGLAVVPDRQLSGRGRGGNAWISPPGCAMFCLQFAADRASLLGQRAPILCHLVALSIVLALRSLLARRKTDLDVRIKWPNDIYLGRDVKVGGILLFNNCKPDGSMLFSVGVGINLDNALPTVSINGALRAAYGEDVDKIERETLLAEVFNHLELILEQYQSGQRELVMSQYYRHWLHSFQEVLVRSPGQQCDTTKAVVQGVDDFGFLIVRDQSGANRTVQPDGNSFDMMSNLILPK